MAVLVLVLWVFFGFAAWAASLADKRGRAPVPHGLLGFFFGPIGVLITALRGPDHAELARRQSSPT